MVCKSATVEMGEALPLLLRSLSKLFLNSFKAVIVAVNNRGSN
jgi:hypothetical protein